MMSDVQQAVRLIARQPLFTAIVCLTLAVGVGANTATFSIVDAALFRSLPYKDADRLVQVYRLARTRDGVATSILIEGADVEAVRSASDVFEGVEVFGWPTSRALAMGTGASPLIGSFSVGLPAFLGVRPALGRTFSPDDVTASDVIVLSDSYWQRAFHRDPAVIGRAMAFADRTCVVVGVMPPEFRYFVGAQADGWLPIGDRGGHDLVARLRSGLSIPQARRALDAATARRPPTGRASTFEIAPADWNRVQRDARVMLLTVMAAVGFVLLIACANVANLLLARAVDRQREIAIRRALGASPAHLVRQFLIEGLTLAAVGGTIATLVGWWTVGALPSVLPATMAQSLLGVSLPQFDARAGLAALCATLLTGVWCGFVPSLRLTKATLGQRGGHRVTGLSRSQRRVRDAFQSLQIALTVVLLVGAGLMLGSVFKMLSVPTGFQADHLWYVNWSRPSSSRPGDSTTDELTARLAGIPGVRGVAIGPAPVAGGRTSFQIASEGNPAVAMTPRVSLYFVDRSYFDVAGIALREGRTFDATERRDDPRVVLVSENAARRLWPGRPAIGQRVLLYAARTPYTVIGVTPQIRTIELAREDVQVFFPATVKSAGTNLMLRIAGDAGPIVDEVRAAVRVTLPGATVSQIGPVDQLFDQFDPLGTPRFYAGVLSLMAAIGLLTAAVGLYGAIAHGVARRTNEIGVRRALGAGTAAIGMLIWRDAFRPVGIGVAAGLMSAWWLSAFAASQLFGVTPHDRTTFAVVIAVISAASALATYGPVRRATKVDPAEALRVE